MIPLSEHDIATSLVNTSLRERTSLSLPPRFDEIDWDRLDYLGWRDPKIPGIGYVVTLLDGGPAGILLRQSDGRTRTRPQCSWCEDVTLPNDVVLFSTKRGGKGGRNGNTIATLVCSEFECSANVRKLPPVAYLGFDAEAARLRRIEALGARVRSFVRDVREGQP